MDLTWQWARPTDTEIKRPYTVEYEMSGVRFEAAVDDVAAVEFEHCVPVRSFPAWRGRRHYDGAFWVASAGGSIPFESLTERACLIELDRRGEVAAVSSQPMWIRWEGSTPAQHVPDFFGRTGAGASLLVDVKPAKYLDDDGARAQFDRTAILCAAREWGYAVYSGSSLTRDANLRFLMRFRDQRWRDELGEFELVTEPAGLSDAAELLGGGELGLARCYYLLWRGLLDVDLEQPLTLRSIVSPRSADES